jgi:hypothetical protein
VADPLEFSIDFHQWNVNFISRAVHDWEIVIIVVLNTVRGQWLNY